MYPTPLSNSLTVSTSFHGSQSIHFSWAVKRIVGHVGSSSTSGSSSSETSSYSREYQKGLSLMSMCRFGLFHCSVSWYVNRAPKTNPLQLPSSCVSDTRGEVRSISLPDTPLSDRSWSIVSRNVHFIFFASRFCLSSSPIARFSDGLPQHASPHGDPCPSFPTPCLKSPLLHHAQWRSPGLPRHCCQYPSTTVHYEKGCFLPLLILPITTLTSVKNRSCPHLG